MIDFKKIEEHFKDIQLKVYGFNTISDGIFNYNLIDVEFALEEEFDVFGTPFPRTYLQDTIKVKVGHNLKNYFEKHFKNIFLIENRPELDNNFNAEQKQLLEKMKG